MWYYARSYFEHICIYFYNRKNMVCLYNIYVYDELKSRQFSDECHAKVMDVVYTLFIFL